MYRYVKVLAVLLCAYLSCEAQPGDSGVWDENVTEKVNWERDTVWYVNKEYDTYNHTYELKLSLPAKEGVTHYTIDWGEGAGTSEKKRLPEEETYTYKETGVYNIIICLYNGETLVHTYYRFAMNKGLSTDFDLWPTPFKYCIESGGDSLLLVLKNFNNPKGTQYDVNLDFKGEGALSDSLARFSSWFGPEKDSVWIEFLQPTGTYSCKVSVEMTYRDRDKDIEISSETDSKKISVYRAPDMRDIFSFKDTIEGEEPEHFNVCTGEPQKYFQISPEKLLLYQYKSENGKASPYYESFRHKKAFDIQYYYSEDPDIPGSWQQVTGKPEYVDTTSNIGFRKGGFYKLRVTAYNRCNLDPETGLFTADTLWTDIAYKHDGSLVKPRYFQVSESSEDNIVCYASNRLCLNEEQDIVLVDRNARRKYNDPPEYRVDISGLVDHISLSPGKDYTYSTVIMKDGDTLRGNAEGLGCDSTVITVHINSYVKGLKSVTLYRKGICGEISKFFDVHIGNVPTAPADTVYKVLKEQYGFVVEKDANEVPYYEKCDSFRYNLPEFFWDNHTMDMDSCYFYFEKGSRKDTVKRARLDPAAFYDFDSTGNRLNYIRVRARNECGWSEQINTGFYTRTRPQALLWRDSVADNDSLCVDFTYPYYFEGRLPENYDVYAKFSRDVEVDGKTVQANSNFSSLTVASYQGFQVHHGATGETEEHFFIRNSDMPSCFQEDIVDTVWLITPPDTVIYDTVRYCSSLTAIDTKKLFEAGKAEFKWADWQMNHEAAVRDSFPLLAPEGTAEDTISYRLSNSKGCYIAGQLMLRPEDPPELELTDQLHRCLPDTLTELRKQDNGFVTSFSDDEKYRLSVYYGEVGASSLLYDEKMPPKIPLTEGLHGENLIYVVENRNVDTAFMDRCRAEDETKLDLVTPALELKNKVGLSYPWTSFAFSVLETENILGQNDMTFKDWKHLPDGTSLNANTWYDPKYMLTAAELQQDSLLFELSAVSSCQDEFKDTLVVELTKLKIEAYKDTICNNTRDYPLWEKIVSENLDESSVTWKIVWPLAADVQGTLSGTTGTDVTYTPPETGTDSVRICVKGALTGVASVTLEDTVVLIVNPAPRIRFLVDTLWACGNKVELTQLSASFIETSDCRGLGAGGKVPPEGGTGGWSGAVYSFEGLDPDNFEENMSQRIGVRAIGLPGCGDRLDTVTVVNPVYAKPVFKRATEEICAGDELKLDTIYTVKGKDRYTRFRWALENNQGNFDGDTTHYIASAPQDQVQKMTLYTYKNYTCYNGNASGKQLERGPQELKVVVHREPVFEVLHGYDTLCRTQQEITLERSWVRVADSHYPDYRDSLKVNGKSFTGDMPWIVAGEGKRDTLVITASQGSCSKWGHISDTLFLYRLPEMIAKDFAVTDVCENGELALPAAATLAHSLAKGTFWEATGGTVSGEPPYFRPDEGSRTAEITLNVRPPRGCETDSRTHSVDVYSLPRLALKEKDTVCATAGLEYSIDPAISTGPQYLIRKVEWYRAGRETEILKTAESSSVNTPWIFTVSGEDVTEGYVRIVEQVTVEGACAGVYRDTLELTLQQPPRITLLRSDTAVCQGAAIDLAGVVRISDAGSTSYTLEASDPASLNGSIYGTTEIFFGGTTVYVEAAGLHGCPSDRKEIPLKVKHAPRPEIRIGEAPFCQKNSIRFSVKDLPSPLGADYAWKFGDGQVGAGKPAAHVYEHDGDYRVTVTVNYATGCTRETDRELTVFPKPHAGFDVPAQAGINKLTTFRSTSTPEELSWYWDIDGSAYTGEECTHRFTGDMGQRTVTLRVETPEGCRDTLSRSVLAVIPPVPKFTVGADSCTGIVNIANQSDSNYAQVIAWDFGNGTSVSGAWNPAGQVYERVYGDTVYRISLTLGNAAGEATFSVPVKMISKLKAGVEVLPLAECNKLDKELHIHMQGRADSTKLWWGDGDSLRWKGSQVSLLKHRYRNDTTVALYFPLVLEVKNVCERVFADPNPLPVKVEPVNVRARILEDTTFRDPCFGRERGFISKSLGFSSEGYVCEWYFEKEWESDTAAKKTHRFEVPGTYWVHLRVLDHCNEDTDSVQIVVRGNDSLDFRWEEAVLCSGKQITLTHVPHGKAAFGDFKWTLPGGIRRSGPQISYTFGAGENQEVKLSATAEGCPAGLTRRLTVHRSPEPLISAPGTEEPGCMPLEVAFYGTDAHDEPAEYLWDFKDNSFSDQPVVKDKVFRQEGVYDVTLTLTTPAGCVDSAKLPVTVLYTPEVAMELRQRLFCTADGSFTTSAVNRSPEMAACAFEWWKGDERLSLQPDSVLLEFGSYFGPMPVRLKATHMTSHCTAEAVDTIRSAHQVVARLSVVPEEVCLGDPVDFENTSEYGGGELELTLGDRTAPVTENRFRHYYEEPGKYPVRLNVSNPEGCRDSLDEPVWVWVHTLPEADFTWEKDNSLLEIALPAGVPEADNGGIRFVNLSQYRPLPAESDSLRHRWDFGDGEGVSREKNPAYVYPNNGNYEAWLWTENLYGCCDSVSMPVDIATVKGLYMPNAFAPAASDEGVNRFQPKGVGLYAYQIRVYDDSGLCVWSSDKLHEGRPAEYWDGTFNGQPLPKGVYVWEVNAVFIDGSSWDKVNGSVILIR